jgi:metallophosphoesterase superfamily enzyme
MWVVGHGHPAVVVSDGVKRERFKCFLEGTFERKRVILVPSFIAHSPGTDPRDHGLGLAWNFKLENFNVHVVSDGTSVFSFGKLKDLN